MNRYCWRLCKISILSLVVTLHGITAFAQRDVQPTSSFIITGLVKHSLTIDMATISKYPEVAIGDMQVKNQRGEDKPVEKGMRGVLFKTILDSAGFDVSRPKELNGLYLLLIASDGYKNVYSWNELFNDTLGDHVFIVTEKEGRRMEQVDGGVLVICTADINTGRRHLKGLKEVKVKMAD